MSVRPVHHVDTLLAALDASGDGIAIVDSAENITCMNKAFMRLCDISVEEEDQYTQSPWLQLYNDQVQQQLKQTIIPACEKDGFWSGPFDIERKDGALINAELSLTQMEQGGFIVTMHDITEQEKSNTEKLDMQNQLHQAQKMEAIGRLAGGIAHDFNNILAAINGYAEFLSEDLEKDTAPHDFALKILQAGRQARALVDQILTFSRQEENIIESIDLRAPLEECLSMLSATLPKSIELVTDIDPLWFSIEGNATQISQMIMNLCVNARDAIGRKNGKILLSLKVIDVMEEVPMTLLIDDLPDSKESPPICFEQPSRDRVLLYLGQVSRNRDYVRLSVGDTGSGMSRAIMERVFEPFFTTKDAHKGTGLGLATTHGTILTHRGALFIDSVWGEGTRFDLLFPLNANRILSEAAEEDKPSAQMNGMVLLVEDQPEVMLMTKTMLERLGYHVNTAGNGLEALDLLRENPGKYKAVITDQNMPKMTGLELVDQARFDFEGLPFILLSGYSEERLRALIRDHAMIQAVIRKPVTKKMLGHTLSEVLNSQAG